MTLFRCSKCGEEKPRDEFYSRNDKTGGRDPNRRMSCCKVCFRARVQKNRADYLAALNDPQPFVCKSKSQPTGAPEKRKHRRVLSGGVTLPRIETIALLDAKYGNNWWAMR